MEVFNTRRKSMLFIFVFIVLFSLMSNSANAENRPGFVCGQFNKNIIEVPDEYVGFMAEYEGYSNFDPRFIHNKKGCAANFRVLPLVVSWPKMQPVNKNDRYGLGFNENILRISLKPVHKSLASLNEFRDNILNSTYRGERGAILYDEELDLYIVEFIKETSNDDVKKDSKNYYIYQYKIYWAEQSNEVISVISCDWSSIKNRYSLCDMYMRMPEIGVNIKILIEHNKIHQWKNMIEKTRIFILNHIKN